MIDVLKFGGSSVGTPERIRHVADLLEKRLRLQPSIPLVVVVSAMGDTTDELLALANQVSALPPTREMDMLLSTGERISMALLAMALEAVGVKAVSLTGSQSGIITDSSHRRARIEEVRGERIRESLKSFSVVIVAGFQGVSRNREITTLGRGGSDTTAVALAAALGARCCEIYTDVAGIYPADPRRVSGVESYTDLDSGIALELAARGAVVIHPRAVEIARSHAIALWVKNTFQPQASGTLLTHQQEKQSMGLESPRYFGIAVDWEKLWVEASFRGEGAQVWTKILADAGWCVSGLHVEREVVACWLEREALAEWNEQLAAQRDLVVEARESDDWVPLSVVGSGISFNNSEIQRLLEKLNVFGATPHRLDATPSSIVVGLTRADAERILPLLAQELGLTAKENQS